MAKYQYALPAANSHGLLADRPQLPYLLPFLAFMIFMLPAAFGHFAGVDWKALWLRYHPLIYTVKTLAAAILLWIFWPYYTKIRWTHLSLGVAVGLVGLVQWVGTEYLVQHAAQSFTGSPNYPRPGDPALYDPIQHLPNPAWRYLFYFVRVAGPALVVPVMEELFWRDFLMRAFIRGSRFQEVAIGTFTWGSLLGVSALFAFGHFQWPSGFIYGLMIGLLLIKTKSIGSCIVAHSVTNLALGIYVIGFHDWQFW